MKGIILAGGRGTRLRPITNTGPKQLIPLANEPVIQYAIEDLREAGITDIGIVLGNKGASDIQAFVGDGSEFGVDVTYILQGNPLGVAHAVGCCRKFTGDDDFVVYLGDNILKQGIVDQVERFRAGDYAAGIALQRVENPGEFGVVDLAADGRIRGLVEKPDDPPSDLALIGVYIFSPRVFEAIDRLTPSWRGELEITEAIQTLICDGEAVDYNVIEGWWKDTGSPAAILEANRLVLDEAGAGQRHDRMKADGATLAEGARVADSVTIEPPVSIGRNVILRDGAHVGPYVSIDDGSTVTRAQVENAVVMDDVTIRAEGTIADSLVGSNTVIDRTGDGSEESCLVVGENSYLEL